MNIKTIFTITATVIGVAAFVPYIKDIFLLKTRPHVSTGRGWAITQGTAVLGIWYGGGGWGALNLTVGTFFAVAVFLFSLKYGSKNITKSDTAILIAAFLAILVWWQLDQPLISIIMVTVIDIIGYVPSFRKSYEEPWSETLISWILFPASNIFAMLALAEYNLLTMFYFALITIASIGIFLTCLLRRQLILKPRIF